MTTMKAIRHIGLHTFPELKDIERPTPAPTEVLLKVAGSGACHSDVAIFDEFGESSPAVYHREFTLGHEVTGWVEEVGSAVEGFEKGDAGLPPLPRHQEGPTDAQPGRPVRPGHQPGRAGPTSSPG
ncbi:alcohol dehydrogenase catalytic domain-containing protein [Corynebacterium confusum]|uniref:alcohol dehydrogenase catalytic domain-containing protein n=1 Tax=uncultured Corynebacterium sp. TaxID=159447 RepID=UPI0025E27355|nr:alcohol dehydrogenase catalytic domain-containing protein [uncultured Corynebacterium sp.]